ncbi:MAG: ABC transporter permease [Clostridium sp.]|uniref:ABC transporter permease n=1 Tax=Clostridium sp. TaxID=1506 RepID=UPI00306373E9
MYAFTSIIWQEYVLFKRKIKVTTIASMISPLLYLIAFGWGLGGEVIVEGKSYINFIIPGVIALTTMTVSYNNTANSVSISRLFYKSFEAFMIAPITMISYTLGKIVAGALIGMYSAVLIIILSLFFGVGLTISPYYILIIVLNCLVFSAVGFAAGIFINAHSNMAKFSSFVITPMSFLCGTFFSLNKMPGVLKGFIGCLPLTHATLGLRNSGENLMNMIIHPMILVVYFLLIFWLCVMGCKRAE